MWYIHTTNCYLAIKKSKVWTYAKHCVRAAKLLQSCPTLFNPMHCCPPGSSVHRILQARVLEWVVMPSSRGSSQPRDWTCISYVSCIGRWVPYHSCHLGSPCKTLDESKIFTWRKSRTKITYWMIPLIWNTENAIWNDKKQISGCPGPESAKGIDIKGTWESFWGWI